jgi:hypothetical protein
MDRLSSEEAERILGRALPLQARIEYVVGFPSRENWPCQLIAKRRGGRPTRHSPSPHLNATKPTPEIACFLTTGYDRPKKNVCKPRDLLFGLKTSSSEYDFGVVKRKKVFKPGSRLEDFVVSSSAIRLCIVGASFKLYRARSQENCAGK